MKPIPLVASLATTAIPLFFFFNDTATTEIYTLSLHDALPISRRGCPRGTPVRRKPLANDVARVCRAAPARAPWSAAPRSPLPQHRGWVGEGLRAPHSGRGNGRRAPVRAPPHPRSPLRGQSLPIS